jgi:hypothetical protein
MSIPFFPTLATIDPAIVWDIGPDRADNQFLEGTRVFGRGSMCAAHQFCMLTGRKTGGREAGA